MKLRLEVEVENSYHWTRTDHAWQHVQKLTVSQCTWWTDKIKITTKGLIDLYRLYLTWVAGLWTLCLLVVTCWWCQVEVKGDVPHTGWSQWVCKVTGDTTDVRGGEMFVLSTWWEEPVRTWLVHPLLSCHPTYSQHSWLRLSWWYFVRTDSCRLWA